MFWESEPKIHIPNFRKVISNWWTGGFLKKSLQNRQLPRVPQGWFGSLGLVPKLKLNSLRLDDTWEFFWQRKPLQTPSSKKNQDDDRSPVLSRVPTLLLMVQNSGKHQLRLVVYPIILQGFSTIQPVVGWPWDFWTIHSMFPSAKGLLFSSWWFNLRRFPQLGEPRNHGRWHPNPNHQSPNRIPGAWEFQPVCRSHDYRWWWDGWEMHPCRSGAWFGGIQNQFLVRVSWMNFVFFEFRFSFLSRVPPILGSVPSNVLMFGYHQVCTTHIKKAYLQGTVLLHFKHLKSLHSGKENPLG